MSVRKSDEFVADIERQFEWYVLNADWDVAERCLAAVESTCQLLGQHPRLGPRAGFTKHVVFYELSGEDIVMRRAVHGHRDLPRRLLDPPGT